MILAAPESSSTVSHVCVFSLFRQSSLSCISRWEKAWCTPRSDRRLLWRETAGRKPSKTSRYLPIAASFSRSRETTAPVCGWTTLIFDHQRTHTGVAVMPREICCGHFPPPPTPAIFLVIENWPKAVLRRFYLPEKLYFFKFYPSPSQVFRIWQNLVGVLSGHQSYNCCWPVRSAILCASLCDSVWTIYIGVCIHCQVFLFRVQGPDWWFRGSGVTGHAAAQQIRQARQPPHQTGEFSEENGFREESIWNPLAFCPELFWKPWSQQIQKQLQRSQFCSILFRLPASGCWRVWSSAVTMRSFRATWRAFSLRSCLCWVKVMVRLQCSCYFQVIGAVHSFPFGTMSKCCICCRDHAGYGLERFERRVRKMQQRTEGWTGLHLGRNSDDWKEVWMCLCGSEMCDSLFLWCIKFWWYFCIVRAKQEVTDDTKLFDEGALGQTPEGWVTNWKKKPTSKTLQLMPSVAWILWGVFACEPRKNLSGCDFPFNSDKICRHTRSYVQSRTTWTSRISSTSSCIWPTTTPPGTPRRWGRLRKVPWEWLLRVHDCSNKTKAKQRSSD